MSTHPYNRLAIPNRRGQLLFTPCPGTKETTVVEALHTLKDAGATAVITLMPDHELAQNGASSLSTDAEALRLGWFQLPIADESVPGADFDERWATHLPRILALLNDGQDIAIHCKGGSGRTGLIAARILIACGVPLPEAVAQVQALRPKAICHPVHVEYLNNLAGAK